MNGLMGMSRAYYSDTAFYNGKKIMAALKQSGAISATLFGILMANASYQSILDIGGYDTANMKSGYTITWIPTETGQFFWEIPFSGVRYST